MDNEEEDAVNDGREGREGAINLKHWTLRGFNIAGYFWKFQLFNLNIQLSLLWDSRAEHKTDLTESRTDMDILSYRKLLQEMTWAEIYYCEERGKDCP